MWRIGLETAIRCPSNFSGKSTNCFASSSRTLTRGMRAIRAARSRWAAGPPRAAALAWLKLNEMPACVLGPIDAVASLVPGRVLI